MINTEALIKAVGRRTKSWALSKVFNDRMKAKKYAGRLFVHSQGVKVVSQFNHEHKEVYYVMEWSKEAI